MKLEDAVKIKRIKSELTVAESNMRKCETVVNELQSELAGYECIDINRAVAIADLIESYRQKSRLILSSPKRENCLVLLKAIECYISGDDHISGIVESVLKFFTARIVELTSELKDL